MAMKKIFIFILSFSPIILWAQATPNSCFDNWTTNSGLMGSYLTPTGWNTENSQTATIGTYTCVQSTTHYSGCGTYSCELTTKSIDIPFVVDQVVPGIITTGTIPSSVTGSITGGIAYTLSPDSITGWYEYTPQGGENGIINFYLFGSAANNADTIAAATFKTPTTTVSTFTRFSAQLVYRNADAVANSIWLLASSNDDASASSVGSTLYIDDLNLVFNSVGLAEQEKPVFSVSPNPAIDHLVVNNTLNSEAIFALYDLTGNKVLETKLGTDENIIDVSTLTNSLYIFEVIDNNNNTIIRTGKLIIQK
jgi:hypothetical protein